MERRYVFGIDFGTESARAILVDTRTGDVVAVSTDPYLHGVITKQLPDSGVTLEDHWALQHPNDYLISMKTTIRDCMQQSGIRANQVVGLGIAFTACTILPVTKEGIPLCMIPQYKDNPHSWVKLWKHHAAQEEANQINELARSRNEPFLDVYGTGISSEWLLPKVLQVVKEAPEIYEAADRFLEAGDWIVLQLTGEEKRNSCAAGYKATWTKKSGYPGSEFLKALHPRLENLVQEKLSEEIYPVGTKAGSLSSEMAKELGLAEGTAVAVATIDAHAAVLGAGIAQPGKLLIVMGTSFCHMCLDEEEYKIPGICGVVEDGIIPGYYGYEAGQAAGGDTLAWWVNNGVPARYEQEAEKQGVSIYSLLEEKASHLRPGESGLLALDWFNGNRSILNNAELKGMIVGLNLQTTPEEIYRALMESLAFGTYVILDAFTKGGVSIWEIHTCGGLAVKSRLLMQILADVSGKEVHIVETSYASGLGAAVLGAIAAGSENGGYDSIHEAIMKMVKPGSVVYKPNPDHTKIYRRLYSEYLRLHEYFGVQHPSIMKALSV
jgi:L-ribulokinase